MSEKKIKIKERLRLNVFDSAFDGRYQQKTTVIFIHGGAGCLLNWKYQLSYFSSKYRTIAYDWRGCGDSDNATSYTFNDHYTDFLALLKLLKVPPKPVLVGHSYGCLIARKYISEHHLDKFVNASLSLGDKGGWARRLLYLPKFVQVPIYKSLFLTKNPILAKWLFASKNTPISRIEEFLDNNKIPSMEFLLGLRTFREEEPLAWIKKYQGKTLLISGKEDKLAKVEEMKRLNELTPNSRLKIIPNAGHFLLCESSEEVNRSIEDFIERG